MNNYKKILAGVLATSMVLSSSMVALADEGRTTGSGKVEGALSHDVFRVVLPTEESYTGAFDYVMDPLDLLQDANNTKYEGYTFNNNNSASLYFYNHKPKDATTSKYIYTNESDALKVINKSTKDVNLTVKVTASSVDGIPMNTAADFGASGTPDTNTSLYLALVDIDNSTTPTETPHPIGESGIAHFTVKLDGIKKGAGAGDEEPYVIQWNPILDSYEYVWNTTADTAGTNIVDEHSFKLVGKCNPINPTAGAHPSREDWLEALKPGLSPELEIVWTVENPFEVQVTIDATGLIKIANCDGDLWDSFVIADDTGEYPIEAGAGDWTVWDNDPKVEKQFQLSTEWMSYYKGKTATVTVTLTDGASSSSIVTFPTT